MATKPLTYAELLAYAKQVGPHTTREVVVSGKRYAFFDIQKDGSFRDLSKLTEGEVYALASQLIKGQGEPPRSLVSRSTPISRPPVAQEPSPLEKLSAEIRACKAVLEQLNQDAAGMECADVDPTPLLERVNALSARLAPIQKQKTENTSTWKGLDPGLQGTFTSTYSAPPTLRSKLQGVQTTYLSFATLPIDQKITQVQKEVRKVQSELTSIRIGDLSFFTGRKKILILAKNRVDHLRTLTPSSSPLSQLAKEIKTIYANLKAKKEDYQKGLKAFESAVAPLGYKLIDLESRSDGLKSWISKEKFRLAEQDREAASLRNEIDALESQMGPLRPQSLSQEDQLQKMHERIAKLKDQWPDSFGRLTASVGSFFKSLFASNTPGYIAPSSTYYPQNLPRWHFEPTPINAGSHLNIGYKYVYS